MRCLSLCLLLALTGLALADPPSLVLPDAVQGEAGAFVVVRASTEGRQVRWVALDRGLNVFPGELLREGKTTVVTAVRPGTYRLAAITSLNDELSDLVVTRVVIGGEPTPDPKPDPPPDPKPDPRPTKCWVVIIEETSQAAVDRGRWIVDPGLAKYIQSKGWRYRIADKDAVDADGKPPRDLAGYIERAKQRGTLPYLFIVDERGKVRTEGQLPRTPAELLTTLQRIGG